MNDARIADRMGHIAPFYVMSLLARARQLEKEGGDLVHMEIGEPDFPTPGPISRAGAEALTAGKTTYTPALGIPPLREAIAAHYLEQLGVCVDPGRVVLTPGASGALLLTMGVLINAGDQVLLADPGYPCNRHFVELYGGDPVNIPLGPETSYQLNAELVEDRWTSNTRAVLVATPSNPTGTLLTPGQILDLYQVVQRKGGVLIVDEIYHRIVFEQVPYTALSVGKDLFVINSFSKYFGMTGWRLGWIVAPETYLDPLERLAQNIFLAPPTLSQHAALAAFNEKTFTITEKRRLEFKRRRDYLLPALRQLGFRIPCTPEGAFYLYADCSAHTDDSFKFALDLIETAGVVVTPGRDFGHNCPERYLRFAYTTDMEQLRKGIERLERFLDHGGT